MSGSSSLASARRRRAAPQQSEPPIIQNKINEQTNEKKMAPLELLQLHDTKIASIQDNIENMVTNLVAEKHICSSSIVAKFTISSWPTKKIQIYVEKKNSEELF